MPAHGDYYWEIGDADRVLLHGQQGRRVDADRPVRLASASKWVFGTYVVERQQGKLTPAIIDALTMRSGYDALNPRLCNRYDTAQSCFARGRNGTLTPGHVGRFSYNGGHDQKLLIDLGFGKADAAALTTELARELAHAPALTDAGAPFGMDYLVPEPAGGMAASPAAYGRFLRRLMRGEYRLGRMLGSMPSAPSPAIARPPSARRPPSHGITRSTIGSRTSPAATVRSARPVRSASIRGSRLTSATTACSCARLSRRAAMCAARSAAR